MAAKDRPRINLSPDQELFDSLEDWANQQMRPVASLCLYLLARQVEQSIESGEYQPSEELEEFEDFKSSIKRFICGLANKSAPDSLDIARIAKELNLEPETLMSLYSVEKRKNGNPA